jgi:hypothetical protein
LIRPGETVSYLRIKLAIPEAMKFNEAQKRDFIQEPVKISNSPVTMTAVQG